MLSLRWSSLIAMLLATLILGVVLLMPVPSAFPAAPEVTPNRADIVVQFPNGTVVTRRITFTETISGLEALRRTGLPLIEKGNSFGISVCRIGNTGCIADDCFCGCQPPFTTCLFWSYERWDGSSWAALPVGAAATTVTNGMVEGWTWGRPLPPVSPPVLGARAALQWLQTQQQPDGSLGNVGLTLDAILAAAATGTDVDTWFSTTGADPLDFVRPRAAAYAASSAASAGKLALAVAATDGDPRSFAGLDLVISMTATFSPTTGAYGTTTWDQAFAMLGLRAAGESVPQEAINRLTALANGDGGWSFAPGGTSDSDSTGLALQALRTAGVPFSAPAIANGVNFLDTVQNSDGGFPYENDPGGSDTSNANSTAFAVQGLLAAGEDPLAARWQPSSANPISYLLSLQQPDGAITFGGEASQLATQQAIPALLGRSYPLPSTLVAARRTLDYIRTQQQDDGSFAGFGTGSTIDAILAIASAGGDPQTFVKNGKRPLDFLATQAFSYTTTSGGAPKPDAAGKLIMALVAAGGDPRNFAGLNLVISVTTTYNPATGAYGSTVWDQSLAMLGLAAVGETIPLSATGRLEAIQATGGGWGFFANDASPDPDSTGLALQALAAAQRNLPDGPAGIASVCNTPASVSNPVISAAIAYLRGIQNPDGGFPGFGGTTDASSTGLVLQGLAAYGEDVRGLAWTTTITNGSRSALTPYNPLDGLLALQNTNGAFPGSSGASDPFGTYQALPGFKGRAFPIRDQRIALPIIATP